MYHQFSPEDLSRLLRLASSLSDGRECAPGEAIDIIERAVKPSVERRAAQAGPSEGGEAQALLVFTERLRRLRARRNDALGTQAFRDPVWDMALDLLVAQGRRQDVSVSSLCVGSGVPQTTALRHIERMEAAGLIERHPDPNDQRRIFVRLKPDVTPRLEQILDNMRRCLCSSNGSGC